MLCNVDMVSYLSFAAIAMSIFVLIRRGQLNILRGIYRRPRIYLLPVVAARLCYSVTGSPPAPHHIPVYLSCHLELATPKNDDSDCTPGLKAVYSTAPSSVFDKIRHKIPIPLVIYVYFSLKIVVTARLTKIKRPAGTPGKTVAKPPAALVLPAFDPAAFTTIRHQDYLSPVYNYIQIS